MNQYITTTLPYVNAKPHMGHAMEMVRADSLARFHRLMGRDVYFNTGTDEHGQKLFDAATAAGLTAQQYVDNNAEYFKTLLKTLDISYDAFIRTTDESHVRGAQEFWKLVASRTDRDGNPFIYKKNYQTKYCVGCELEKSDSDLVDGKCPDHPNLEIQFVDEENYFFRFSSLQDDLLALYDGKHTDHQMTVLPDFRLNEVRSFVASGLQDFSISRLASKMSWGVPVPGDSEHVMYVWFDALANYITTLGWGQGTPADNHLAKGQETPPPNPLPKGEGEQTLTAFEKFWINGSPVQYFGQDNLRQQTAMWQAMLLAAGLPPTRTLVCNGFIMGEGGVKMSKTIGNVVDPIDLIEHYGVEAVRLYVLRHIHPWDGSPMSYQTFHERYTADLVNGLGNLVSRLLNLCEKHLPACPPIPEQSIPDDWVDAFNNFRMDSACEIVFRHISELDQDISTTEPFKLVKTDLPAAQKLLSEYVVRLYTIARMLNPILPNTSQVLKQLIKENKKPETPLFPRLEVIQK
jgi:methionyl-tRNA synthetase